MKLKLYVNWVHFLMKFGTNLCKESLRSRKRQVEKCRMKLKLYVNWVHLLRNFGTNLCKESLKGNRTALEMRICYFREAIDSQKTL